MVNRIESGSSTLFSSRQIAAREGDARTALQRLASGRRINTAADDAAGLAIASKLLNSANLGAVAARNISDGTSLGTIAEGALSNASDITGRLRELTAQASNGVLSDAQRQSLNQEYQALRSEIDRIGATTQFNGAKIFGSSHALQLGSDSSAASNIDLAINDLSSNALGLATDISTQEGAQQALDQVSAATNRLSSAKAEIGSTLEVLQSAYTLLQSSNVAQQTAASRIQDVDIAQESSNQAAANIGLETNAALAAHGSLNPYKALDLFI